MLPPPPTSPAPPYRSPLNGRSSDHHFAPLDAMAGHDTGAIEIVGEPFDLEVIVDSVTRALQHATPAPRRPAPRE